MHQRIWIVYIFSFFFITLETTVYADTMVILDASSAMKEEFSGTSKMALLKKVLKKKLNTSQTVNTLGLSLFGHRNLRNCRDVQSIISSDRNNSKYFISKLETIKAKGTAPLLYALKTTAQKMHYKEKNTTIILIASRNDSCYPDPCAMAKFLKSTSQNLRIHVMALGVDKKSHRQLSCIAKVSDGQYFSIKNEIDLSESLEEVFRIIQNTSFLKKRIPMNIETNESVKEKIKQKINIKPKEVYNLQISANEKIEGEKVEFYGYIYKNKTKESSVDSNASVWKIGDIRKTKVFKYQLEEGTYHLSVEYENMVQVLDFDIKENNVTRLNLILGETAQVQVKVDYKKSKIPFYGYIYSRKKGKKYGACIEQLYEKTMQKPYLYRLPLGKYMLILAYEKFQKELPFEIKADESTLVSLKLDKSSQ